MKRDSIIFDLDGTLWNSTEGVCISWNEAIKKYSDLDRVLTQEELHGCMGLQLPEIADRLFPELPKEKRTELMDMCCELEEVYLRKHGGQLFEGLEETLKTLSKDYKLFIVSNCQDGYIQCFLEVHHLSHYFIDVECSGATGLSKGENNKLIIERNHLQAPIYVGDTHMDATSAKVAGIPFIYASYGFGQVEAYDYTISSIKELPQLISHIS